MLPTPREFISGYANTGKKISIAFITFFFVMAMIKREILTSREVLYTKSRSHNQFLFCKKYAFQNVDFSHLKCQLKQKQIDTACF